MHTTANSVTSAQSIVETMHGVKYIKKHCVSMHGLHTAPAIDLCLSAGTGNAKIFVDDVSDIDRVAGGILV
jgi:hypothetical protein